MSRRKIPKTEQTNMKEFYTCHLCTNISDEIAKCSKDRCKLAFCFQCIVGKLNKDFLPSQYKKQFWICYACGGSCKCILCKGLVSERKTKRSNKNNQNSSLQDSIQNNESTSKDKQTLKEKDISPMKKTKLIKKIVQKGKKISSQQKDDQSQEQEQSQKKIQIQINFEEDAPKQLCPQQYNMQRQQVQIKKQEEIIELKVQIQQQANKDSNSNKKIKKNNQTNVQQNKTEEVQNKMNQQSNNSKLDLKDQKCKQLSKSNQSEEKNQESQMASSSQSEFQQILKSKTKKVQAKTQKKSEAKKKKTRRTQFQLLNAMHRRLQQPHVSQSSSSEQVQHPMHIQKNMEPQIKKQWMNIDTNILRNRIMMNNLCLKVIYSRQNLKPQWNYILNKRRQLMAGDSIKKK